MRLASGLFSNAAGWGDEIDPTEQGWRQGLENLRLYMTHFAGLPCSSLAVLSEIRDSAGSAWQAVADGLGLLGAGEGAVVETAAGAPRVAGVVESVQEHGIVVRTEEPAPGLLEVFAFDFKGPTLIFVRGYLYGETGSEAVEREQTVWKEWLAKRLPGADTSAQQVLRAG